MLHIQNYILKEKVTKIYDYFEYENTFDTIYYSNDLRLFEAIDEISTWIFYEIEILNNNLSHLSQIRIFQDITKATDELISKFSFELTVYASFNIFESQISVLTFLLKTSYNSFIFIGEEKKYQAVSFSLIAFITFCCLRDLSKSLVECLLLTYFNAFSQSNNHIHFLNTIVLYQPFQSGY